MKNIRPIFVFFGQPGSGKSTIALDAKSEIYRQTMRTGPIIDGDNIRSLFKHNDYSKSGRIKNLYRISDISIFLAHSNDLVFVSAVFPYESSRDYLDKNYDHVYWFYLTYDGIRGREQYHAADFEIPEKSKSNIVKINTSENDSESTAKKICAFYRQISNTP